MNINNLVLGGNLTRDPEMRVTGSGKPVTNFTVACNHSKDEASFFDCVAFGKTAELIADHFSKGKPIIVTGSIRQNRWEDKESGQSRSKVEVWVSGFHFVGGKE